MTKTVACLAGDGVGPELMAAATRALDRVAALHNFELDDRHLPNGAVSLVEVPAMAISSTSCRQRVAAGLPVWYLVPDGVVQYISKRGLYQRG